MLCVSPKVSADADH